MPEAWRIVKAKHSATAFSGEGAVKTGGRWNSRGVLVVYASSSKSLALLETLVHLTPPVSIQYSAFRLEFDAALAEVFPAGKLPPDWRCEPPPPSTKAFGDAWAQEARSALLAVPSIISGDLNYLVNPNHSDFRKVIIGKPEPFVFDPRLLSD
jgi:RES domain-containing protein